MKLQKIFVNALLFLLIVMTFAYLLIDANFGDVRKNVLEFVSKTGLSIIGFLFLFPTFVFMILSLSMDRIYIRFWRDMFALFTGVFVLASGVIALLYCTGSYYVPVILIAVSLALTILALVGVIKGIKAEKEQTKEEQALEENKE